MCRFGRSTSPRGSSHDDGWCNAPPILSFSSRRKRENAPCTVEERKRSNYDLLSIANPVGLIPGSGYLYRHCLSYGRTARNRLGRCLTNRPASLSAAAALALFGKWPVREPAPQGGSLSPRAKSAAARRAGQALLRPPKPPLAPRRGQKTCVKPEARLARPPVFSLPPCTAHSSPA